MLKVADKTIQSSDTTTSEDTSGVGNSSPSLFSTISIISFVNGMLGERLERRGGLLRILDIEVVLWKEQLLQILVTLIGLCLPSASPVTLEL